MLFAVTIFLSAFLLFQVQPMVGKYILPWFGPTPGVWTTALLFFQLMLLAGYASAHFVVSRLTWRRQAVVHATLLALALIALPITPAEALKPTNSDAPIGRILLILTLSVGAPFFLLSATAPLIQRWFAQLHPGRSPYRLYALSKLASLLALLSIEERDGEDEGHRLSLTHGRIRHGHQLHEYPTWPTTYYGPRTGIALAVRHHPARSDDAHEFRVGIIGLGVGTMAAYANHLVDPDRSRRNYVLARDGGVPDHLRFYEINPLVVKWANERFTFLSDATARGADVEVFEGDARIGLERQIERDELQRFDVLAVDAFSSDAIPIHLLTQESFQTYLVHLQEDGILAIHVTNRYVDLVPIVGRLAEATGLTAIYIESSSRDSRFVSSTDWILLTRNEAFLAIEAVREDEEHMPEPGSLWTDDFSSVFEVVEFGN